MSEGMSFLTGAAVAGVALLFMLKGGDNPIATSQPSIPPLPLTQTNPYSPYGTLQPMPTPTIGATPGYFDQQRMDNERLRSLLEQQRTETEQLKVQLQSQQMLIEKLTAQTDPNVRTNTWSRPLQPTPLAPQQQQENSILSGVVWALGGMAVTISGGLVVVGVLAVLARQQQRPTRTTYVVPQPYQALPPYSSYSRRRGDGLPPQVHERQVDYVEYDQ